MRTRRAGAGRPARLLGIAMAGSMLLASFGVPAAEAAIGDLRTFAGGIGDGGLSPGSTLVRPDGVATAGSVVYLSDAGDHRVRKIDAAGIITTIAGTGVAGYDGDGAPATAAKLNTPRGLAADGGGNVYIADEAANVVRKVSASGTITTIAGKGAAGFSGDDGPAVDAELSGPTDVAVDGDGNVYIADFGNKRVRRVAAAGGAITTVAGNGSSAYQGDKLAANTLPVDPRGVAVDGDGNLYIADTSNHRIRKVFAADQTMDTFAGLGSCPDDLVPGTVPNGDAGPAAAAVFCRPGDVTLDAAGAVYVADTGSQRIRKIDGAQIVTTIGGTGTPATQSGDTYTCPPGEPALAGTTSLCFPTGIAVNPAGEVFVADSGNSLVRKIATDGSMPTAAGGRFGGDGGPAEAAVFRQPRGVAVDGDGNVFVSDTLNHRVRRITPGGTVETVTGNGTPSFTGDGAAASGATVNAPAGLAVDENGVLFIADSENHRIRRVDKAGIISTVAGNGTAGFAGDGAAAAAAQLNRPLAVAVDAAGNLFIADSENNRVRKVDAAGTVTTVAGDGTAGFAGDGAAATSAQLNKPSGVAVFDGALFISDTENHRIRKVAASGMIASVAGTGTAGCGDGATPEATAFNAPGGLAVDVIGQIFVSNALCGKVHRIDPDGKIETLAGTGTLGFSGESGKAIEVVLGRISGVATDRSGGIFLADTTNSRIRLVEGRPPDSAPPVVSLATTPSLSGMMTAAFDEAVKNVTPENVVLRAGASDVATSQACRDEASVFVDCATGKVRTVRLDPVGALTPGQNYSLIVNPAGVSSRVTDVAGNPAPTSSRAFRASTVEQESSLAARYNWRTVNASSALGRSYTMERTPGATAVVLFSGNTLTWYTVAGPDMGLASVYIDGVFKGTFNQYASTTRYGVARIFDGLSDGPHRFVLVVRGLKGSRYGTGVGVALDALRATSLGFALTPNAWYGWQNITSSSVSGGRYTRSEVGGSWMIFSFSGTRVDWYTLMGPNMGTAAVYIDGVLKSVVDNYYGREVANVRRTFSGLSAGTHWIKIVPTGRKNSRSSGTLVAVDRFVLP